MAAFGHHHQHHTHRWLVGVDTGLKRLPTAYLLLFCLGREQWAGTFTEEAPEDESIRVLHIYYVFTLPVLSTRRP